MNSYHKADTAEQKIIRDETVSIYMDLYRCNKTMSREDMLKQIMIYQPFIIDMMAGVVDNAYDNFDYTPYTESMEEFIVRVIGMKVSIGLDGIMPIGKHIVADFERMKMLPMFHF